MEGESVSSSNTKSVDLASDTPPPEPKQSVDEPQAGASSNSPSVGTSDSGTKDDLFDAFYSEVKEIEKQDSVLTPALQIERLNRPGATYFNLNPFDVLQVDPDASLVDIKVKFRRLSILVHPDKNLEDKDRAQKAFDALHKAWKTLENEEGYKRAQEVVEEAKIKVEEMIKAKRKAQRKQERDTTVAEDDPEVYRHAVYVQTCKLFADLERLRQEKNMREMHERKRKAEEEEKAKIEAEEKAEWDKNYEESRQGRVSSWQSFTKKSKKRKIATGSGAFRPPKVKPEQR